VYDKKGYVFEATMVGKVGVPHLLRDWAHLHHICTGTGLSPATSSSGLGSSPLRLRQDWVTPPHLCGDWAQPRHICVRIPLISAADRRGSCAQCCSLQGKAIEVGSTLKSGADTLGSVFIADSIRRVRAAVVLFGAASPRLGSSRLRAERDELKRPPRLAPTHATDNG
jgi:hypothetical protein